MSCNTEGKPNNTTGGFGLPSFNNSHCYNWQPTGGVTVTTWHYPTQNQNINWPGVNRDKVMYGSVIQYGDAESSGTCGRQKRSEGTRTLSFTGKGGTSSTGTSAIYRVWDPVPAKLSFFPIDGDQWFAYMYDTSSYFVGTPCAKLETYKVTTASSTTTGSGKSASTTTTTTDSLNWVCSPCGGTITPAVTGISYSTPDGDLTGIPDRPYPTIYTAGTNTNRVVFKYNSVSATLTNSVTAFSLTVNGTTAAAWANGGSVGTFTSTLNNWQQNEFSVDSIQTFQSSSFGNKGLKVAIRFRPIVTNYENNTYTFGGTEIEAVALENGGQNYAVNETYSLTYVYTHTNNATSTFTLSLRVDAVANVPSTTGSSPVKILKGETINGWTISKVYHTDLKNFPWHLLELTGSGSNFTKDTNYTTSGGKSINVAAGKGIVDRAMIVGLYEFRQKEVQYETWDLKSTVPHAFDDIVQPEINVTVTNGKVTGATIVSGGSGFNKLPYAPTLSVGIPPVASGTIAEVSGTFTNGVLTSIKIVNGGSGYSSSNPPGIAIPYLYGEKVETVYPGLPNSTIDSRKTGVKQIEDVYGSITKTRKDPENTKNTSYSDLKEFSSSNDAFEKMPDHFLVKYFRSKNYTDPQTGKKIKTASDFFGEQAYLSASDAAAAASEYKAIGCEVIVEKKTGQTLTEYVQKSQKDFEKLAKETQPTPKNTYNPKNEISAAEYAKILETGKDKVDQKIPIELVEPIYDPKTKITHPLNQAKFDAVDIAKLPYEKPLSGSKQMENLTEVPGISEISKQIDVTDTNMTDFMKNATYDPIKDAETEPYDLPKITTVKGSFSKLPCASRYRKYYIRQYTPDSRGQSTITITLSVSSASSVNCANVCTPCPQIGGIFGSPVTTNYGGAKSATSTATTSLIACEIISVGPTTFSASGTATIYNNLTASTQVFASAVAAWGNPFESECS